MTIPLDHTSINSFFDWIFHTADITLFGSVGVMLIVLLIMFFTILTFVNANKFTIFGFMASILLAFGYFGYTIVGWIAPLGALLAGLLLGLAFIKMIGE
jgi:hypothetical protein